MMARFFSVLICAALALASLLGAANADAVASGRELYEQRCRTCHRGTAPTGSPLGFSLAGIMGSRAGIRASAMHSRIVVESPILWDRESLRRFLQPPGPRLPTR
jgi:cytochrome c2